MKRMLPTTKKENDFTEYHAGTDLLPLQKSMIQRDEKQDEASSIACIGVWTIPQTLQATRKTVSSKNIKFSAGERNLSCFQNWKGKGQRFPTTILQFLSNAVQLFMRMLLGLIYDETWNRPQFAKSIRLKLLSFPCWLPRYEVRKKGNEKT